MKIELAEPCTEEEFERYYQLRYQRLRKPHGLPPGSERDDAAEASSTHVIAKMDGRVVGAVCWVAGMHRDEATGTRRLFVRLRQIAVDQDLDRRGIGSALAGRVEQDARALGAKELVASVRVERVPFFESIGYAVTGPGKTLFGSVEHVSMTKPLR